MAATGGVKFRFEGLDKMYRPLLASIESVIPGRGEELPSETEEKLQTPFKRKEPPPEPKDVKKKADPDPRKG